MEPSGAPSSDLETSSASASEPAAALPDHDPADPAAADAGGRWAEAPAATGARRRALRPVAVVAVAVLVGIGGLVAATWQSAAVIDVAGKLALNDVMPVDPAIRTGTLANGLRYYVRANRRPERRAELRLGVNAGSLVEDDDQRGLAHFVEHMAFNGTADFPGREIIRILQTLGMSLGPDVNATTSYDQTIYTLRVPTENPAVLDRAMLILENWAHKLSFDDAEIDQERGVINEEWRLRRGAAARVADIILPSVLTGSRYADRAPIGTMDVIQGVKHDRLRQFYKDWYRPNLMAVVAVGDFDPAMAESLIKSRFGALVNPAQPRPRPAFTVPDHDGTRYTVVADKEVTTTTVTISNLLPPRPQGTVGVYRQQSVDNLFSAMLTARMSEIAETPDPPFLAASAGRQPYLARARDAASLNAVVTDNGVVPALLALATEASRVAKFGFTATELTRAKQNLLRAYERLIAEKDTAESASLADEYLRNFFVNETLPGIELEYALQKRFLPEITLDEVNGLARSWFGDRNRVVVATLPEKAGVVAPTETRLAETLATAAFATLTAYVDRAAAGRLIETPPAPGTLVRTTPHAAIGVTEWQLSNGVRIVLKPTDFKEDEVVFRATSWGGTSLASDADYIPASVASQVVAIGGVGAHSDAELRRLMTGKVATVTPFISAYEQSLSGSASRQDLETLFQMIYLRFTAPRLDRTLYGVLTSQARSLAANQASSPDYLFNQTLATTLSSEHPRSQATTPERIDQWNADKSFAFYKDRFANAASFTFVFAGSFTPEEMRPLAERYLGALPARPQIEMWKDVGIRPPRGIVEKEVRKGLEPKSHARIVFSGPAAYDLARYGTLRAMTLAFEGRLRASLRETLGGTYSVATAAVLTRVPEAAYSVSVDFTCDPQRMEELVRKVFEIVETMKTAPLSAAELAQVRGLLLREFDSQSKQNAFLAGQLASAYLYKDEPEVLWTLPAAYQAVDSAAVRAAATTYLDTNNYVRVTQVPEK